MRDNFYPVRQTMNTYDQRKKGLLHKGFCHHARPLFFIVCHMEFVENGFKFKKPLTTNYKLNTQKEAVLNDSLFFSSPRWWTMTARGSWRTMPAPVVIERAAPAPIPIGIHIELGQVGVVSHALQVSLGDDGDAA